MNCNKWYKNYILNTKIYYALIKRKRPCILFYKYLPADRIIIQFSGY
jgi:hypothetical protein